MIIIILILNLFLTARIFAEDASEIVNAQTSTVDNRIERSTDLPADLPPKELNLRVGERLVYDIQVNGLPAGKTQLLARKEEPYGGENGPRVWVVTLETRSNRVVSLFYEVHDRGRTMIDVKGGFSRFYHIDKREGNIQNEERISFKYDIGNMEAVYERPRWPELDESRKEWRVCRIPLIGKTLDPLSALYYLRQIDLEKIAIKEKKEDRIFYLPICADRRVWNTKVYVERSRENFAGLKNRECFALRPLAEFKGLFERKSNMIIYVDAATRILVRLTAEIPIGAADVILSDYANCSLPERAK